MHPVALTKSSMEVWRCGSHGGCGLQASQATAGVLNHKYHLYDEPIVPQVV